MAMRRPRIKPVANIQLNSKRKAKSINDVKIVENTEKESEEVKEVGKDNGIYKAEHSEESQKIIEDKIVVREDSSYTPANEDKVENNRESQHEEKAKEEKFLDVNIIDKIGNDNVAGFESDGIVETSIENAGNETKQKRVRDTEADTLDVENNSNAFKCPPKVEFQRSVSHISNSGVGDVFYSDIEENAIQMDLEKSPIRCPTSPSKNLNRQRIKPTPHFGQRRNSFIGTSPTAHSSGNEDGDESVESPSTKRERHHSASFTGNNNSPSAIQYHHQHHTPHKYFPTGVGNSNTSRIRTESGCSAFSDTNISPQKSRKLEDTKQNPRKDFEARFINGVPEKSAIKMYDLIYYNPATNPMEQKANPNVKFEQSQVSSNDVKPIVEKREKDTNESTESEGVPVPQLKLNAKGELILDDKSLIIETTAEQEARKVLANSSLIYLDENTGMNGFYSRQKRTRDWLPSETIKFYRCLQNVGTDFSLMVSLFPNRTRRDLKLKFKKEERKNDYLINKALLYPKLFDLEALKQQIDEEEKLREEQAKIAKEKGKQRRKRKLSTSAANRVLLCEGVYQNENVQKPKKVRKTISREKNNNHKVTSAIESNKIEKHEKLERNIFDRKSQQVQKSCSDSINTSGDQVNEQINEKESNINKSNIKTRNNIQGSKTKRRRKRTLNKMSQKEEIAPIKKEIIKIESKQDSNNASKATECFDGVQLQTEMDDLLNIDAVDINYSGTSYDTSTLIVNNNESQSMQQNEAVKTPVYPTYIAQKGENCYETDMDVNLSNDSTNVYKKIEDIDHYNTTVPPTGLPPPSPPKPLTQIQPALSPSIYSKSTFSEIPEPEILSNESCSSVISESEINEEDIQSILTELANGSLVLVSSLDPDDPDKVLNEIYMVDKNTGELYDEPLNIPDSIVQCILSVVS